MALGVYMKRVVIIIIFIIFMILLLLFGFYNLSKVELITMNNDNIPVNSSYKVSHFCKIKNATIINGEELIFFNELGKKEINVIYKNNFNKKLNKKIEVNVVDDISPIIECENITITEGDKLDINSKIKATDNYDKEVNISIEGTYNIKKAGTYKLKCIAIDSSNNRSEKEFDLIVKKKKVVKKVEPKKEESKKDDATNNKEEKKEELKYIDGILIVNKTYSLPSDYNPKGLTSATSKAKDELFAAAKEAGFPDMRVGSGFRSYKTQKSLYNSYVKRDGVTKADTYSARAGHSEHQTGLAIDVCHKGYSCITSKFDDTPPAKWLNDNAYKYGFIIRYPKGKTNETGYKYESWHLRYVGVDLATKLYNNGDWITLESYFGITSKYAD
jgi:LAS superfamily LD-carboxypeptidase LdcB